MADRHTTVFGDQIDVTALGLGLVKDGDDNLQVAVDDTSVEISEESGDYGQVRVKDLGISTAKLADEAVTEGKIDVYNTPTIGYYMKFTANGLEWSDVDTDAVQDVDVICNEIPSGLINSLNADYTVANTPVVGTVQVYLNGLFQAPGGGLDYTISETTITFVKAPRTGSDLYVFYIIA